ncbi:Hypothetical predicted protein [Cloeon dipterum]|uniref:Uncharacterized protein n=1 Tax=Cloeon dipterum TaxID=197152 RepID=A0A8S1CYE4_9INSE|nr:Hypothetical predicted protein [Cloeon dipterum]
MKVSSPPLPQVLNALGSLCIRVNSSVTQNLIQRVLVFDKVSDRIFNCKPIHQPKFFNLNLSVFIFSTLLFPKEA